MIEIESTKFWCTVCGENEKPRQQIAFGTSMRTTVSLCERCMRELVEKATAALGDTPPTDSEEVAELRESLAEWKADFAVLKEDRDRLRAALEKAKRRISALIRMADDGAIIDQTIIYESERLVDELNASLASTPTEPSERPAKPEPIEVTGKLEYAGRLPKRPMVDESEPSVVERDVTEVYVVRNRDKDILYVGLDWNEVERLLAQDATHEYLSYGINAPDEKEGWT